ncbi:transcriptional regulator, IclR family protein [Bacillaceae bacterium JMAK1]|nr:transcriptional regulator, IclR family protein [Bacillaceae bacterium JMAK1]
MSEVLKRSAVLLEALRPTEMRNSWTLTEISRHVDIPTQTVHRLLNQLVELGFVYRDHESKTYRLGLTLMQLGLSIVDHLSVRNVGLPIMRKLGQETNESVYLTIPEGTDGIFIECIESPHFFKIVEPVGMRRPLHKAASKKVILAFYNEEYRNQVIQLLRESYRNELSGIEAELEQINRNGYAVSYGETTEGTTSIAAPVFSWEGEVIASLSVAGPNTRFKASRCSELTRLTKRYAQELSTELGYLPTTMR